MTSTTNQCFILKNEEGQTYTGSGTNDTDTDYIYWENDPYNAIIYTEQTKATAVAEAINTIFGIEAAVVEYTEEDYNEDEK